MSRRVDDRRLAVWRDFLRAHAHVVGRLNGELERERGLPLAWYEVLLHLAEAPTGALPMGELGRRALFSKSGITRLVDRMAAEGLVCRRTSDADRRVTYACLTPEGRARLRRAAPLHLRGIHAYFAGRLTDAEVAALEGVLAKILDDDVHEGVSNQPAG